VEALPELAIAALASRNLAATPLTRPVLDGSIGVVTRTGRQAPAFLKAFIVALRAEDRGARDGPRLQGDDHLGRRDIWQVTARRCTCTQKIYAIYITKACNSSVRIGFAL
jgi:hypothetical protein